MYIKLTEVPPIAYGTHIKSEHNGHNEMRKDINSEL